MQRVVSALTSILAALVFSGAVNALAWDAKIYAALGGGEGVAVIDPSTLDAYGVIKTGRNPARLALSNDKRFVYVSLYGEDKVVAIDTATETVVKTVKVGKWPFAIDVSPDGGRLLVGCRGDNSVWVIDTAEFREAGRIKTQDIPDVVKFSPDGRQVYVVNDTRPMQIFDLASLRETGTVDMPENVSQLAFSMSGKEMYYLSAADGKVAIMDAAKKKVVKSLDAGVDGIALSPDGGELWFGGPGGVIRVYSFLKNKVIAELPRISGFTSLTIAFSSDGRRVLAGPAGDDGRTINVYGAESKEKAGEIKLPAIPGGMLYITK